MQALPESVRLEAGRGGLRRLRIATDLAEAEIYLHGAHITHFQPRGQNPVLFMSQQSYFEPGKPIRGGVPVCFPWFGPRKDGRPGPAHGFARLLEWELTSVIPSPSGELEINLTFASTAATKRDWDGDFRVDYRFRIGTALGMEFNVTNTGPTALAIEEALHTYLAVSDVRQVSIDGFAGTQYSERITTPRLVTEGPAPVRITAETDRIYLNTQTTCTVHDPGWQRRLIVEKTGSNTTVLWNPWVAKSKAMPDFGDDEWPGMLCIETCNVSDYALRLEPGRTHQLTARVSTR